MQKNFNVNPAAALPGMWLDNMQGRDVISLPAASAIPFGVLCEIVVASGIEKVQAVQDSGTTSSFLPVLAGISLLDPLREQTYPVGSTGGGSTGYAAGEMVPLARRGRLWVLWDGSGNWPDWATVNVWHSSDGSASAGGVKAQGVFTMHATQTTLHSEIDAAPTSIVGIKAQLAFTGYTDAFGNSISAAPVSILLG